MSSASYCHSCSTNHNLWISDKYGLVSPLSLSTSLEMLCILCASALSATSVEAQFVRTLNALRILWDI